MTGLRDHTGDDDWPDDDNEYDDRGECCPRCSGDGTIDCHCGGDLCVCDNYGEMDCPLCHGEGVISVELAEWSREKQRELAGALEAARSTLKAEGE